MIEKTGRFLTVAAALLLTGVIIQAWLGSRGGIGGDQYVLFDLGLDYLEEGRLSAVGKGMSGGGFIPGSLLQLLIGVPFSVWRDYRSPVVLIGLFHLLAAVVSTLAVRRAAFLDADELKWVRLPLHVYSFKRSAAGNPKSTVGVSTEPFVAELSASEAEVLQGVLR